MVRGTKRESIVLGWHANWYGQAYKAYNYNHLTALCYYSYDVDPLTGMPLNPADLDQFKPFVEHVHSEQRLAFLSVALQGEEGTAQFLRWDNEIARRQLIDSVLAKLDSSKADGVELHFVDVPLEAKADFQKFLRDFSYTLRAVVRDTANPKDRYRILLSVPAYDPFDVYNLAQLQDYFDYAVVLGFDFHRTPESKALGQVKKIPVAPLNYSIGDPTYDLRACVDRYLSSLGRYQAYRLILVVPYFGTKWIQKGATAELLDHIPYNEIRKSYPEDTLIGSKIRIDSNRMTMIWEYIDTMGKYQGALPTEMTLYYDDAWTLEKKYKFINEQGLGGVGIWFLGAGIGFESLDKLIEQEFTEFFAPENDKLAKLKQGSSFARKYAPVMLTILLFWAIFMACGFCFAMVDVNTRQALFVRPRFRFLYLSFFTVLLLIIGGNLGLFEGPSLALLLGVLAGAFIAWLALRLLRTQQAKQP